MRSKACRACRRGWLHRIPGGSGTPNPANLGNRWRAQEVRYLSRWAPRLEGGEGDQVSWGLAGTSPGALSLLRRSRSLLSSVTPTPAVFAKLHSSRPKAESTAEGRKHLPTEPRGNSGLEQEPPAGPDWVVSDTRGWHSRRAQPRTLRSLCNPERPGWTRSSSGQGHGPPASMRGPDPDGGALGASTIQRTPPIPSLLNRCPPSLPGQAPGGAPSSCQG